MRGGLRGHRGGCESEQSWARGSYEVSRAATEPPQNLTSAAGTALVARSGDEIMNSSNKPIGHPYEGRRANLVDNFS